MADYRRRDSELVSLRFEGGLNGWTDAEKGLRCVWRARAPARPLFRGAGLPLFKSILRADLFQALKAALRKARGGYRPGLARVGLF